MHVREPQLPLLLEAREASTAKVRGGTRYQVVQALGVSHGVLATCFSAERAARRGVQVFTRFA